MARKSNPELQEKVAAIKRTQILEAARVVFAEKGFHRATIKAVAAKAGVADGTVYSYFENKTALILGLLHSVNRSEQRETDFAELRAANIEPFVRSYTRERFRFMTEDSLTLFQALLPEILSNPELRALYRQQVTDPTFALAERAFAQVLESSDLTKDDARLVLRVQAAMLVGLIVMRIIGDDHLETHWDKVPDLVTDFVLGALRPKETPS